MYTDVSTTTHVCLYAYVLIYMFSPAIYIQAQPAEVVIISARAGFDIVIDTYIVCTHLNIHVDICRYTSTYARRMGQHTQRATNYTARSNIVTAQIFLHANGQRPKRASNRQRSRRRQARGATHRARVNPSPSKFVLIATVSGKLGFRPARHEQALVCLSNREIVDASRGRTFFCKMANTRLFLIVSA